MFWQWNVPTCYFCIYRANLYMATCCICLSLSSENSILAKDILYAEGGRHPKHCFSSFSTTSQTHVVIYVVMTSRFTYPSFCISVLSQHTLQFILSENLNILRTKEARANVLEFIDHPSWFHIYATYCWQDNFVNRNWPWLICNLLFSIEYTCIFCWNF